jgi:SAM-dependent methyltransferase
MMMDEVNTRLCSLPWQKITVNTQSSPPRAAPCRNFPLLWSAWDLAGLSFALQLVRNNLLAGSLGGNCLECKDKRLGSRSELFSLLESEGLKDYDGNKMIDSLQEIIESPSEAPPAHLTYRVAHTEDPLSFIASGVISIFDILSLVKKYDTSLTCRLLDWGCGSGRISRHIAKKFPEIELTGCDIDSEAVDWCNNVIKNGDFRPIDPEPPTTFERGQFTSIIGFSIVTHLTRELQIRWIKELHELLAEGGIIVLTTHGEQAARVNGLSNRLEMEGVIDELLDETLGDIVPAGYYRSTFQSKAWTEKNWGEYFDILEYIEGGAFDLQDILVLKKKETLDL